MISAYANLDIVNSITPFHWDKPNGTTLQTPIPKIKGLIVFSLTFQVIAASKRTNADNSHAVGDGDACKRGAILERKTADACHAVGDGDACK